jgi:hypothetical protein
MSIMDKLKKNSKIKETSILSDSKFFTEKDMVPTDVPMMNVALSGSVDGGLAPGLTVLAGPSKHFKTSFGLIMASAYLKKYKDAVLLFYDSEFGSPQAYFQQFDIDTERVLHTPITNVEELKFDIIAQMEGLDRNDKVVVMIDSVGNLASKKELEDAINEKSVADMSRAKALKGLFRMTTPYLNMKNIPLIAVKSYSGLLDVALTGNYVAKPSNGWYCRVDRATGELIDPRVREKDTLEEKFWLPIFESTDFKDYIKSKFAIGGKSDNELVLEDTA